MANIQFVNYVQTTLVTGVTAGATTMVVTSTAGFPTVGGGLYAWVTMIDAGSLQAGTNPPNQREIVKLTQVSGNNCTIVRGQDGTTGQIWAAGDYFTFRFNAQAAQDLIAAGGGAPTSSTYVLQSSDVGLPNRRILTGSATVSVTDGGAAGPITLAVPASSIANANLANMAGSSIKGNNTGGSAPALDLTVAQTKTLLAITPSDVTGLAPIASSGSATDLSAGTVPAARMPAHTGDVTSSAGSVALTIAANAVTNAKAAQMGANTIKGNNTGGTANAIDLTPGQIAAMLPPSIQSGTAPNIINGGCEVGQGAVATLATTPAYGTCALFKVGVIAGTVSAGTIIQATAAPVGRTGYALQASGCSMASTPTIAADFFLDSKMAVRLKNASVSFSCNVYQDTGSSLTYTVSFDKANTLDNFGAVTNVGNILNAGVLSATPTLVTANNVALGDVSNGLRIRVSTAPGTTTTKNFYWTEWVLEEGAGVPPFVYLPFEDELRREQRWFYKTFPYSTAPTAPTNFNGAATGTATKAGALSNFLGSFNFHSVMRTFPGTVTYFNPSAANSQVRDSTAAGDCSATATTVLGDGALTLQYTGNAATVVGNLVGVHFTIDCRF